MTSRAVDSSDGVRLTLHRICGSGPPLLICHATGFHGLAYAPLASPLGQHFSVWAVDFRGHGRSTAPESGDFAWQGMADDVLACIDAIGTRSVVAVGHSMGGSAILLAELARPGSIDAAYMFEPIVFPSDLVAARAENALSGLARKRRRAFPSKQAAFERYASRPPLNKLRVDALAAYVEHGFVETDEGEVRLACEPEHEARTFDAADEITFDRLKPLALRLAVAAGATEEDPGPADFAATIAATVPGAVLRLHPELGHFGPLEAPDKIAAEIVDLLAVGHTDRQDSEIIGRLGREVGDHIDDSLDDRRR